MWVNGIAVNRYSFLTCSIIQCHVWLMAWSGTVRLYGTFTVEFVVVIIIIITVVVIIIIIISVITFMLCIYSYMPESNHMSMVYTVTAVLYLQSVLHVMLFHKCNMFCTFTLALSACSMCAVPNMAVFSTFLIFCYPSMK